MGPIPTLGYWTERVDMALPSKPIGPQRVALASLHADRNPVALVTRSDISSISERDHFVDWEQDDPGGPTLLRWRSGWKVVVAI